MRAKSYITAVVLYLVSTGASYATFELIGGSGNQEVIEVETPEVEDGGRLDVDPGEPRTETCPLNGDLFTKTEKEAWEVRRPLLVMIENHLESRPQSGLSAADVVYETIAEGGITRFMAVFYCEAQAKDVAVAPVRSARTYFLDWASEYGEYPLYAHVGGANCSMDPTTGACKTDRRAQALEQIQSYGWGGRNGNDMNQFSIGYPTYFRDYNRLGHSVATEHTMVSSTEKLWDLALDRGWTNLSPDEEDWMDSFEPWNFEDGAGDDDKGNIGLIAHDFWEGYKQYDAKWEYSAEDNVYRRFTGGEAHMDHNNGKQVEVKNVVIQFTKEIGPVDDLKHMLYETTGKGKALVFKNGDVEEVNWTKLTRTDRTVFTDRKGGEIEFVRGPIWVSVLNDGTTVSY